jgi:hypothetical protein
LSIAASDLQGRTVLVGIRRYVESGSYSQEQHIAKATIVSQSEYDLVRLHCQDGEIREYPFDERFFEKARPGEYRLTSTGEVVQDPDFLMAITITKDRT